jgi:hypothetical protein
VVFGTPVMRPPLPPTSAQRVSCGKPDVLTVIGDAVHVIGAWKGSVLTG